MQHEFRKRTKTQQRAPGFVVPQCKPHKPCSAAVALMQKSCTNATMIGRHDKPHRTRPLSRAARHINTGSSARQAGLLHTTTRPAQYGKQVCSAHRHGLLDRASMVARHTDTGCLLGQAGLLGTPTRAAQEGKQGCSAYRHGLLDRASRAVRHINTVCLAMRAGLLGTPTWAARQVKQGCTGPVMCSVPDPHCSRKPCAPASANALRPGEYQGRAL